LPPFSAMTVTLAEVRTTTLQSEGARLFLSTRQDWRAFRFYVIVAPCPSFARSLPMAPSIPTSRGSRHVDHPRPPTPARRWLRGPPRRRATSASDRPLSRSLHPCQKLKRLRCRGYDAIRSAIAPIRVTKMPRAGEPARGRNALRGWGAELSAPGGQTRLAAFYSIAQRKNGRPEGRALEARSDRALQFGTTRLR
jgi:hypothetical protein